MKVKYVQSKERRGKPSPSKPIKIKGVNVMKLFNDMYEGFIQCKECGSYHYQEFECPGCEEGCMEEEDYEEYTEDRLETVYWNNQESDVPF